MFKHIDTYRRHKRQINPLYVVGDIADWTFGETNIIIVCEADLYILMLFVSWLVF